MDHAPSRRFAWINAAVWSLYGAFNLWMGAAFVGLTSGIVLVSALLAVFDALASATLRALVLRRGWLDREPGALVAKLLLAVPLAALAVQVAVAAVVAPASALGWIEMPGGRADYRLGSALTYWANTAIVLGLWTAGWVGARALQRARQSRLAQARAEAERHAMELEALRARLNPHFVFNALNNLRALILEDPQRARELVTRLSSTLRHALEYSQGDATTLAEELAVVEDYLAVEAVHYEQRLRVERAIDPAALDARVPPMALQLLVENAIKHGIARTPGGGALHLRAGCEGGRLSLEVRNPGRLGGGSDGAGVGLRYLRRRLEPHGGRIVLEQEGGDVVARMEIPQ
jgi:signal transduction histidine kinase